MWVLLLNKYFEFVFEFERPVTRSFDVFFDLHLNKRLSKQSWGWWLETPSGSLWRHCNLPLNCLSRRFKRQNGWDRGHLLNWRIRGTLTNRWHNTLVRFTAHTWGPRATNDISIEFEIRPKFEVFWFKMHSAIKTKFCVRYDSVIVVACAKFRCDRLNMF